MKECLILVGPDKWCLNHVNFLNEHKESLLFYDKFPRNYNAFNMKGNEMIQKGDFKTYIYVSKNWGGDGKIEYVAYTHPLNEKSFRYIAPPNVFFLQKELIAQYKEVLETMGNEESSKLPRPIEPPGILPNWDYYDFGKSKNPKIIENVKEYMKDHLPRPYNIAIKIHEIKKIKSKKLDEFEILGGGSIKNSHLENSFIIALPK